jgi:hypothetical protein
VIGEEARLFLAIALGAGALCTGIALLWRRVAASERAAHASLDLAREAQRGERFTRALEQLADDRLEVRLGAIYSLEQVAAESAARHWPVMEVLCAFLRSRAAWESEPQVPGQPPTDVLAALTVLGRRNRERERDERLDLRRTDLRGVDLKGVNLSRADLRGAWLSNADLAAADLRGADLREANLESAYLVDARLEGANLGGAQLAGASLGGAHLEGADLSGALLEDAYLYDTHLDPTPIRSVPAMQRRAGKPVSLRARRGKK